MINIIRYDKNMIPCIISHILQQIKYSVLPFGLPNLIIIHRMPEFANSVGRSSSSTIQHFRNSKSPTESDSLCRSTVFPALVPSYDVQKLCLAYGKPQGFKVSYPHSSIQPYQVNLSAVISTGRKYSVSSVHS